ncbi:MAG: carboxypeptidase-like regulatory domain-containing protein [Bryobacteraceae bacterium]
MKYIGKTNIASGLPIFSFRRTSMFIYPLTAARAPHRRATACFALFFALMLPATISAQVGSARVRGSVADPSGAPVPHAAVSITNTQTGAVVTTKSNGTGEFSFPDLQAGRYELSVRAKDFKEFVQSHIALVADQRFSVNVPLQVGELTEVVSVSAAAAQVGTQTGTLKDTINAKQIEDLPL